MPDFTVDVDGLNGLQKDLERTGENIDNAARELADASPDTIGSDELDEACADFYDSWKNGLGEINEVVGDVKKGLSHAAQAYAEIDKGIRDALQQMQTTIDNVEVDKL